jgi:hypothetical protein
VGDLVAAGLYAAVRRTQQADPPTRLALAVCPGTGSGLRTQLLRSRDGAEFELVSPRTGPAPGATVQPTSPCCASAATT